MTPAEIKTLREGLGLSTKELGYFLGWRLRGRKFGGAEVEDWEAGRAEIPADVVAEVVALDSDIERIVIETLNHERQARGTETVLIRYESRKDLGRFDSQISERSGPVALQVHCALLLRVSQGLRRMGRKVRIIYMDRGAYDSWRDAQRIDETHAARHAWAAGAAAVGL